VQVLQGIAFVLILASEALRGVDWQAAGERFRRSMQPKEVPLSSTIKPT
jgi:simple sugar transport system permease protein